MRRCGPGGEHTAARTSSTSTTARSPTGSRDPAGGRPRVPMDDLGLEHYGIDTSGRTPYRTGRPAAHRRRPVGHRRSGRSRAPHPPGALPGRAGGRMALGETSCPTTGPCRGRPTRPEVVSVGVTLDGALAGGPRRVRTGGRLPDDRQGLLGRGDVRSRDDRGRPAVAPARRSRDGRPRRVGGDPRVRPGSQGAACRSRSSQRPSTRSRRRRASSTACSPTPAENSSGPAAWSPARARSAPPTPGSASALERDLAVHQDHRRAGRSPGPRPARRGRRWRPPG